MSDNRVVKVSASKEEQVTGRWGKSVYEKLISAAHQTSFRMIKSKRVRWSRYVVHTTE
jgi:hypothetical protein